MYSNSAVGLCFKNVLSEGFVETPRLSAQVNSLICSPDGQLSTKEGAGRSLSGSRIN
jgi:hypothetical protein